MSTGLDLIDAPIGRVQRLTSLPLTPRAYYGGGYGINRDSWQGGELVYLYGTETGQNKLYIQLATSGQTSQWKTIATQFTDP